MRIENRPSFSSPVVSENPSVKIPDVVEIRTELPEDNIDPVNTHYLSAPNAAKQLSFNPNLPPERQVVAEAGEQIDLGYADTKQLSINTGESLGSLRGTTRQQRLEIANRHHQIDRLDNTTSDPDRCAATCLTVACLSEGGETGLLALIDGIQSFQEQYLSGNGIDLTALEPVVQRLRSGESLSMGDLSQIEDRLYEMLDRYEQVTRGDRNTPGLGNGRINLFLDTVSAVDEMLSHAGIGIRHVDNGGDGYGNHFILLMGNTVYDPYPRSDGNQLIQSPELVNTYRQAVDPEYGTVRN